MRRLVALVTLGCLFAAAFAGSYTYSHPAPRPATLSQTPELFWLIYSKEMKVESVAATLDGKSIPANYDHARRGIVAESLQPLEPGVYEAAFEITFVNAGGTNIAWEFEVLDDPEMAALRPDEDQPQILRVVNDIRAWAGLPPLSSQTQLARAALGHTLVLDRNRALGHFQSDEWEGFFGNTPRHRAQAFGYLGSVSEVLAYSSDTMEEATWSLFHAPFHRIPFLNPGARVAGAAYEAERTAILFSFERSDNLVLSPQDGATDVPLSWHDNETPDPLAKTGLTGPTGYPLVVAFFGHDKLSVSEFRLRLEDGSDVAARLILPDLDPDLDRAAILMPVAPLQPNTLYRASIQGFAGDEKFSLEWRFTTGSDDEVRPGEPLE